MPVIALLLDLAAVVLFAALGRDTHAHTLTAGGIFSTAWPFMAAVLLGWLVARAWRAPWRLWPAGVIIWLVTVVGGLAIRGLSGGGLAFSFELVTLGVLGVFLLGLRLAALPFRKRWGAAARAAAGTNSRSGSSSRG